MEIEDYAQMKRAEYIARRENFAGAQLFGGLLLLVCAYVVHQWGLPAGIATFGAALVLSAILDGVKIARDRHWL